MNTASVSSKPNGFTGPFSVWGGGGGGGGKGMKR
jgi:hypothetical protein